MLPIAGVISCWLITCLEYQQLLLLNYHCFLAAFYEFLLLNYHCFLAAFYEFWLLSLNTWSALLQFTLALCELGTCLGYSQLLLLLNSDCLNTHANLSFA